MNRQTLLATTVLALASWPMAGHAQSWETATGLTSQSEIHRGTLELRHCTPTGDVLSVGTASPGGSNPNTNLLVQRLSPTGTTGAPRFIAEYDSNSQPEQGARAAEYSDGSGFVTVGSLDQTTTDPTSRLVVTKFDCNGQPQWRFSYGATNGLNLGADILQAKFGNGTAPVTVPGDVVALGNFQAAGSNVRVPRIVRLSSSPSVSQPYQWGWDYPLVQPAGGTWSMAALAEMAPPPGSNVARLVAVGAHGAFAAAMVVDGNTGAPICAVRVDGLQRAQFHDVVAYKDSTGIGFIAVGQTSSSTQGTQMYLARFDASCGLLRHAHWGYAADVEIARATDLTLASTHLNAPAGVLMVGGEVNGAFTGQWGSNPNSQDGYLTLADPQTLLPYTLTNGQTAIGMRYGAAPTMSGAEKIFSISAAANGAYLAGSTTSPFPASDPQDAYTLRALNFDFFTWGQPTCSEKWRLPATLLTLARTPLSFVRHEIPSSALPLPQRKPVDDIRACCKLSYGPTP